MLETCFFVFLSTFERHHDIQVAEACNKSISMLEYTGLLIFKYTRDNNYYSCILVLNITKAGFQHKPRIFFLFCDLDFMIFFEIVGVIHGYFGHKTWKPFVVFMKLGKKSLNLEGFAPIDRGRHRFMKPPKPSRFQLISLSSFMNTTTKTLQV